MDGWRFDWKAQPARTRVSLHHNNKTPTETLTEESWVVQSISPRKLTTVRKNWRLASSVLSYLSCVHIKWDLALITTKPKKQEWKTWAESRGMWCDAFSNSCIHSELNRRKVTLFHSELISGFQTLHSYGQRTPPTLYRKVKVERHIRVHVKKIACLNSHTCTAVNVHITGRPSINKHKSKESSTIHYSWVISNMSRKSCELRSSSRPGTRPTAVCHTQPKCPVDRRGTAPCSFLWQPGSPTKNIQAHTALRTHMCRKRGENTKYRSKKHRTREVWNICCT